MAYTVSDIKVHAYNYTEQPDFTIEEKNLFLGLAYCYEWYRLHPEDKADCDERAKKYIEWFEWAKMREIKKGSG